MAAGKRRTRQSAVDAMNEAAEGVLSCGGLEMPYQLCEGGPRRTRLVVRVMRNGRIEALYPRGMSLAKAHSLVRTRAQWAAKHILRLRLLGTSGIAPERVGSRYFLGRAYSVEWLLARSFRGVTAHDPQDSEEEARLVISARDLADAERLLRGWYEQRAAEFFPSRLGELVARVGWLNAPPALRIRHLRRRWGSCSSRGIVTLAVELARLPVACVDYVILHEIAHLRQLNHSPAFYAELSRLMPDWKERKRELEAFPSAYEAR